MTGIILDVYLQLKNISLSYMDVETIQFSNLEELFNLQYESMVSQEYLFAWLDSHINWTTLSGSSYLFSGIS